MAKAISIALMCVLYAAGAYAQTAEHPCEIKS